MSGADLHPDNLSGQRRQRTPARLACLTTLLACLASNAAQADVNLSGYAKTFVVGQQAIANNLFNAAGIWQAQTNVRLKWDAVQTDNSGPFALAWQCHYELSPGISSRATNNAGSAGLASRADVPYRFSDPSANLVDQPRYQLGQNLDRLNVQLQFASGDLTLGRQAMTFGSARIINPTDVFLPFAVGTLNTEYRTGIDGIRFQRPLGQLGELDLGLVLGQDGQRDNSAAFVHVKTNLDGNDLEFTAISFGQQTLLGAGVQTSLGTMGFWFEGAVVNGADHYWRVSTGLDYAFNELLLGLVEYHYNGAGGTDPNDYLGLAATQAYQRGGVFLLGQHYLIPGLNLQLTPLLTISAQAIINLADTSAFVSVDGSYNLAEDLYLGAGYYHFTGKAPTASGLAAEYGASPDALYMRLSLYF
jgi:hypothetical protein